MNILTINIGSSSIKYALIDNQTWQTKITGSWNTSTAIWQWQHHTEPSRPIKQASHLKAALKQTLNAIQIPIHCIAHRVVHGGCTFTKTTRITHDNMAYLRALDTLAPLHNPLQTEGIQQLLTTHPDIPQMAVFDTAFHATLPVEAYTYAIPEAWQTQPAIRRYGFHGLSYADTSQRLATHLGAMPERMITCHLGNGASVCAMRAGKSVATSMGFTPLAGLVMGSRCGDIDPGILDYVASQKPQSISQLMTSLQHSAGLRALCAEHDMRQIQKRHAAGDAKATRALNVFAYHVKSYIGQYIAHLGPLNALIFTGGIGENASLIRAKILENCEHLGLTIDQQRNQTCTFTHGMACISPAQSACQIWVIQAEENRFMAQQANAHL